MTGIPAFTDYEAELRDRFGAPNQNIFTVSGLTGTGSSTIAAFLAEQFDMERFDAGQWFRQQAEQRDMDIHEFDKKTGQIEEQEGIDFDLEWDRTALKYAFTRDNFVLEGRLAGVLLKDIAPIRVWVHCDLDIVAERLVEHDDGTHAERLADRDHVTVDTAKAYVQERNQQVMQRYREKYGVNPRREEHYNVSIDNSQDIDAVKTELVRTVTKIRT